jgi:hypothetical protein
LGFYWLSIEKSRSNETNGVASTAGFAKATARTGRLEEAPREVLPAASHIRPESFSETRHIVALKLHANATASADLDSKRIGIDKKKKNYLLPRPHPPTLSPDSFARVPRREKLPRPHPPHRQRRGRSSPLPPSPAG